MSIKTTSRHDMPFGTKILSNGIVEFNLWAPDIDSIKVNIILKDSEVISIEMTPTGDGWFKTLSAKARPGCHYCFELKDGLQVPDPASRFQPGSVHGPSEIIDPDQFDWGKDHLWKGRPWEEAIIYELHTGTFTKEGTYNAIKNKLDYLVSLGVTAIELMPVASFPGEKSWGYDGVLLYAPDCSYGHPEELKDLIKTAHEKGLMVLLDVVYNHFGPDGNYLYVYAKSKFFSDKLKTPWGDAINFDNRNVRDFFVNNAIYWLKEYHFDGLRLDAIHAIKDPSSPDIIEEIAQRAHLELDRHIHLVLENDNNESCYLTRKKEDKTDFYQAQWNDDFHHCAHILMTGEESGYYEDYTRSITGKPVSYYMARTLAEGFAYQGEPSEYRKKEPRGQISKGLNPRAFVNFIQNHDQIGNRAFGERLSVLSTTEALKAAACIYLIAPSIPLIYMGEEWASDDPFLFFCDFGEDLAESVREGRRNEFAKFPQFSDPEIREMIPDPMADETFNKSKLSWDKISIKPYSEMLEYYKTLLQIRKNHIMPLIPLIEPDYTEYHILNDRAFTVKWSTRDRKNLYLAANTSEEPIKLSANFARNILISTSEEASKKLQDDNILNKWSVCWLTDQKV